MKNILICERFAYEAQLKLSQNKNFKVDQYSSDKLATANALIIRSKFEITQELLEKAKNLK